MLVLVIHRALTSEPGIDMEGAVRHAAVHGWLEGHIDAEDTRRPAALGVSGAVALLPEDIFPMPPFPRRPPLHMIVRETLREFADGPVEAAVAYAAALGWKGGAEEGAACSGCSFRGRDPKFGRAIREGRCRVELTFHDVDAPLPMDLLAKLTTDSPTRKPTRPRKPTKKRPTRGR